MSNLNCGRYKILELRKYVTTDVSEDFGLIKHLSTYNGVRLMRHIQRLKGI